MEFSMEIVAVVVVVEVVVEDKTFINTCPMDKLTALAGEAGETGCLFPF